MGESYFDAGHNASVEPSLQPIEERDTSPGSSSSTALSETSPHRQDHQPQAQQSTPRHDPHSESHIHDPPPTPLSTRAAVARQPTETGSVYHGQPSLRNRTVSQQPINPWPTHSLAGSTMPDPPQGGVYIDPQYRDLNPKYGGGNDRPVWGLAKPLPRVVRPGMRRNDGTESKAYETKPPGESAPAPELEATPGLTSSQSNSQPQGLPSYSSAAQQGLAKQNAVYAPQPDGLLRPMESEAGAGLPQEAGPEQQIEQPAEEEFLNTWVKARHYLKEPLAEWLAVCESYLNENNFANDWP